VIPLHELRVGTAALVDANGSPIDVLWRLYPLEHIAADRDGPKLFDLVERGRLRLINPPCALLMQNKAALAILWELAQSNAWFDATERALIERLFLPTFLDLPATDAVFVRKPVLGREGDSVAIVRGSQTLTESASRTYIAQPVVYQQFVPLPRAHGGQAIVTCFVIAGAPGAVAMRVGGEITDGHARFMSIGAT
jgi:glutathionylspermidine synthase